MRCPRATMRLSRCSRRGVVASRVCAYARADRRARRRGRRYAREGSRPGVRAARPCLERAREIAGRDDAGEMAVRDDEGVAATRGTQLCERLDRLLVFAENRYLVEPELGSLARVVCPTRSVARSRHIGSPTAGFSSQTSKRGRCTQSVHTARAARGDGWRVDRGRLQPMPPALAPRLPRNPNRPG